MVLDRGLPRRLPLNGVTVTLADAPAAPATVSLHVGSGVRAEEMFSPLIASLTTYAVARASGFHVAEMR